MRRKTLKGTVGFEREVSLIAQLLLAAIHRPQEKMVSMEHPGERPLRNVPLLASTPKKEEEDETEISRSASLSPTETEVPPPSNDTPQSDGLDLSRTKSIAQTLSLPHEIAFVALVCGAQLFTRAPIHLPPYSLFF